MCHPSGPNSRTDHATSAAAARGELPLSSRPSAGFPAELAIFWFEGYQGPESPSLGTRYCLTSDTAELNDDEGIRLVGRADEAITPSE
jgi:hypothetical protein